jgi:hypothetical protein
MSGRGDAASLLERLGRLEPLERLGRQPLEPGRRLRPLALTLLALALALGGLGVAVAVVAALAGGVGSAARALASAPPSPRPVHATVVLSTEIVNGPHGWPEYRPATFRVRLGETVVLRIRSFDDGTAPLTGAEARFDAVSGTVGGTELVDGRARRVVPDEDVAHTFTVVALGLNLPVPAAPTGGSVLVVARFVVSRVGSFVWQCYAPCGTGAFSMGGPMATPGFMEGTFQVTA